MEETDLSSVLLSRLMYPLVEAEIPNLSDIKAKFSMILGAYKIEPKEEALVVWTEGKNEYYVKRFLLAKSVAGLTPKTIKNYGSNLRRIFRDIGKDADTVSPLDIQAYLAMVMSRSSKINADNMRRSLSTFYTWLHREEIIAKNPMNRVDSIKLQKKPKYAFTDMECELLRDNCSTAREKAIIETLFSTWCRVSELCSIKVLDIEGDQINVLGKGNKYRYVYLNAKAQVAIRNYLQERTDSNPYLFPRRRKDITGSRKGFVSDSWYKTPEFVSGTEPMDKGSIEYIVRRLGKRAGVENTHPHRFRRTGATMALKRGMPIEQVSKTLGHESLATTQIYLDLSDDILAASHRKYVT